MRCADSHKVTMINLLVFIFLCGLNYVSCAEPSLRYVVTIFRHGDRSAIHFFPTDPNPPSSWPDGPGQLSEEGLKQHLLLGKWMRKRYDGFLSSTYKREELYVRSTDYERTLMSAEAHLAGLFWSEDSTPKTVLGQQMGTRPVPIHTMNQFDDTLLDDDAPCNLYGALYSESYEPVREYEETRNAEFFRFLADKTQYPFVPVGIQQATRAWDTLFCEGKHGMKRPDWFNESVWKTLSEYRGLDWVMQFYSEPMLRLRIGLFLKEVLTRFYFTRNLNDNWQTQPFIDQKLLDPKYYLSIANLGHKFAIYSAHDSNLVALLRAFGHFRNVSPPYASCLIFELHQFNADYSVKLLYLNQTITEDSEPEILDLRLPTCTSRWCTLEEFTSGLQRFIPEDWNAECNSRSSCVAAVLTMLSSLSTSLPSRCVTVLFGVLVGVAILLLCRRRLRSQFFLWASHSQVTCSPASRNDELSSSPASATNKARAN